MVTQPNSILKNLYDIDYHRWLVETVRHLENQAFEELDLDHLIEEILDLRRREKRRLQSLLTRLWEHLLKLKYWQSQVDQNQAHWKAEILNFRKKINRELSASPSLRPYLVEIFETCYLDSRDIVSTRTQLPLDDFPTKPIAELNQVLDEAW